MRVLFIGGTGEISRACVSEAVAQGHEVFAFNRNLSDEGPVPGSNSITGELEDPDAYGSLAKLDCEVVCQFLAYQPSQVECDIALFGCTGAQYVLVSSASIYRKPMPLLPITERSPLGNPHWEYSRRKQACEDVLLKAHAEGRILATIVRPSHTYRRRLPSIVVDGKHLAWRILNRKPVIVPGDGESVWTLTHATDFARAFVRLFGAQAAMGEVFHITAATGQSWNIIVEAVASVVGAPAHIISVGTDELVRREPSWEGPLMGDKATSMIFDNAKIRTIAVDWKCEIGLEAGIEKVWKALRGEIEERYTPEPSLEVLVDQIANGQPRLA